MNNPFVSRRQFLQQAGLGFGSLALTSLLHDEGLLAADPPALKATHLPPRCKAIIWLFMTGGPLPVGAFDLQPDVQKRVRPTRARACAQRGRWSPAGHVPRWCSPRTGRF